MGKFLFIIIAIAIIGGASFYGGIKYARSKGSSGQFSRADFQNLSPEERQQRAKDFGGDIGRGPRGNRDGGGFAAGEILSKEDKSVTIKLQDGGSKIIFLSDSTEITKSVAGSLDDLEIGKNITANGTANSDGSITAQTIQLRPELRSTSRP